MSPKQSSTPDIVYGFDPGETTGVCKFVDGGLTETHQLEFFELGDWLARDSMEDGATVIVEAYRLRAGSAKSMIGSDFPAAQVVGLIKYFTRKSRVSIKFQSASQKEFFNNERLKTLGFYQVGHRHARDSIRHVLYYLSFTLKDSRYIDRL